MIGQKFSPKKVNRRQTGKPCAALKFEMSEPPSVPFYVFKDTNRLVDDGLLAYAILFHDPLNHETIAHPVWPSVAATYNEHCQENSDHIRLPADDLRIYYEWLGDRLDLEHVDLDRKVLEDIAFGSFTRNTRGDLHRLFEFFGKCIGCCVRMCNVTVNYFHGLFR